MKSKRPVLIIVNGLPGTGKTTLAKQLAHDVSLPLFSRDGIYETLSDAFACDATGFKPLIGSASYRVLFYIVGSVIAAGQGLIIEGFFGRPNLRTAEFRTLKRRHDFEPLQIMCKADGSVLLERFLARSSSRGRHHAHPDLDWLEQNKERLLRGVLSPLELDGQLVEIDTTTRDSFDYGAVLQKVRSAISISNLQSPPTHKPPQ